MRANNVDIVTFNFYSEELMDDKAQMVPIKKICEPEEIAEVFAFLISDKNSYMTGAEIFVDGGITLTHSMMQ